MKTSKSRNNTSKFNDAATFLQQQQQQQQQ